MVTSDTVDDDVGSISSAGSGDLVVDVGTVADAVQGKCDGVAADTVVDDMGST